MTATYNATVGRNPSEAELQGGSANLADGFSTQASIKINAANSQEALNNLNNVFTSFVGLAPDPGATSVAQNDLAQGASIAQATNDLLASDSFQESLQFGLEQTLQDTLPNNEVAMENYVVQQDVTDLAPITWQTVASTVSSSIINFLENLNPIGTANAKAATPASQQAARDAAQNALNDPRIPAFLKTVGKEEGATYTSIYGYHKDFVDFSHYPTTTAAGKYQIIPSTYDIESNKLGLSDFESSNLR